MLHTIQLIQLFQFRINAVPAFPTTSPLIAHARRSIGIERVSHPFLSQLHRSFLPCVFCGFYFSRYARPCTNLDEDSPKTRTQEYVAKTLR